MVEFNMLVPVDEALEIDLRQSDQFRIISKSRSVYKKKAVYFLIESDIEEFTYFTLKYGPENVWPR